MFTNLTCMTNRAIFCLLQEIKLLESKEKNVINKDDQDVGVK